MNNLRWIKINDTGYEICETGDVRNIKTGRVLKQWINSNGYWCVEIRVNKQKRKYLTHRLLGEFFLTKRNVDDIEIDHINRVRTDNTLSNLRWVTNKENLANRSFNKLKMETIINIINDYESGLTIEEIFNKINSVVS